VKKQLRGTNYVLAAVLAVGVLTAGCKSGGGGGMTEAEKATWKGGGGPPPGFEKEMAKHADEWREREARTAAKLGKKPETPPPGVVVK
jgi:hypothetical protein